MSVTEENLFIFNSFECHSVIMTINGQKMRFVNIYRPPNSNISLFLRNFETLILNLENCNLKYVLLGDFNIWFGSPENVNTKKYSEILNSYDLTQYVNSCTRCGCQNGHIVDHIILNPNIIKLSNRYYTSRRIWLRPSLH